MSEQQWFVMLGDVSGMYEGNPLSLDASLVYGPYTAAQASEIVIEASAFPHASYAAEAFTADSLPYQDMLKKVKCLVREAIKDANESAAEQKRIQGDGE